MLTVTSRTQEKNKSLLQQCKEAIAKTEVFHTVQIKNDEIICHRYQSPYAPKGMSKGLRFEAIIKGGLAASHLLSFQFINFRDDRNCCIKSKQFYCTPEDVVGRFFDHIFWHVGK